MFYRAAKKKTLLDDLALDTRLQESQKVFSGTLLSARLLLLFLIRELSSKALIPEGYNK